MDAPLWSEGASPWPHEREALAFVKERLPNHEPYRAWSNVEFIAEDGSVNEIDLLVVTPHVFALVEIKSYPGKLFGDGQKWRNVRPDGREHLYDHPLILVNTKAKRLRSLLARQRQFRDAPMPWITGMVFLSSPELDCRLHDVGRTATAGRDPEQDVRRDAPVVGFAPLPGIVAALKDPTTLNARTSSINRPTSARIADAIEAAGLKPAVRGRKAGDWEIGELIDEGPGWQDFEGSRPRLDARRRVRVYLAGAATTPEEEARLRREADREFRLLQGLRHDGIADAKELVQADRGPAVLFDRSADEQRLDLWAAEHLGDYSIDQRIELVRQLGEALAHAHSRHVTHRALTARCIVVVPPQHGSDLPQLVIGHWQAGAREMATRLTRHGVSATDLGGELAERVAASEQVYLAPETFTVDAPDPVALDVFSLGALAFMLLSGVAPGTDIAGRDAMLSEHGGLYLPVVADGLPEELTMLVQVATDPVSSRRETVRNLLALLDDALDTLTRPDDAGESHAGDDGVDPLSAHQGDVLEGGWQVLRRLGSGSTAVALLCLRPGSTEPEVLKVAKDEEYSERLLDEARALERAQHACLVKFNGVERIGGRTVLRLDPAGDPDDKLGMTLADRLHAQGRLGLDLLERFGDDLLDVVHYLESEGVAHRDIKPDNLGVRPRRGDRSLHLVLFDLSLTKASDTSLGAGTPGYLDPFLAERPARRWDPSAERYAAAATLHEMATGARPKWGDGLSDPIHLTDIVPSLDSELFDPAVRNDMVRFFERALHRGPDKRFDNADQMRQAWRAVFAAAGRPTTTVDDIGADEDTAQRLAAAASPETPVTELGLSGLSVSALERRGITTVEQLLRMSLLEWNRASGVGMRVRREVTEAMARLRSYVEVEPDDTDAAASIDRLVSTLIAKPTTAQAQADQSPLGFLLGIDQQLRLDSDLNVPPWPSTADVRAATDLDRAGYDSLLDRARARWAKQPAITQVRSDIATLLERSGGVLPADELAEALLVKRGSISSGATRLARGRAVVRAALETEAIRANSRFTWRRLGGGTAAVVALRSDELDAEELADYAANLGIVADQLAATDPLPSTTVSIERLRAVATPVGLAPLADFRLARLAATTSATAAVSSRLELYPRGLTPERSIRLARAALLGAGTLSEEEIRARVHTRFPAALALPRRPQLDRLLDDVLGLQWFGGGTGPAGAVQPPGFWVAPLAGGAPSTMFGASGHRHRTGTVTAAPNEDRLVADDTHSRLVRQATNGGYLVMTVSPRFQQRAIRLLADYGPDMIDVDSWVINAMRSHAETKAIRWNEAVLAADADGPTGNRWSRLMTVVRDSVAPQRDLLLAQHRHVLLTHPGLLGRYDLLGMIDLMRDRIRQPEPEQTLRTLWLLVAADDPDAPPTIGGRAVPITTSAEHLILPLPWLENLHKTAPGMTS